jgi:hypothetical protein
VDDPTVFLPLAEANVAKLRARRERLARDLQAVQEELAEAEAGVRYYRKVMGERVNSPPPGIASRDTTYADLAAEFMVERGAASTTTSEVVSALAPLGKEATYGTVYSALARDPRFRREGRGRFVLRDRQPDQASPFEDDPFAGEETKPANPLTFQPSDIDPDDIPPGFAPDIDPEDIPF